MAYYRDPKLKVFTCNSNPALAESICRHIGVTLGKANVSRFSDGEIQIHINESVRGADVFVIQSTSEPVNEHLMELLVMVDALKRASAKSINCVMPYYGYSKIMETTALGAAYLAGLATGFWKDLDEVEKYWEKDATFEPEMSEDERDDLYAGWEAAVEATRVFKHKPRKKD